MSRRSVWMVLAMLLVACPVTERSGYGDTPYLGEIRWVGFNFAPKGWSLCNGQILSISQNQALFALLGTTYGGDGRTTFALPNLQGRILMHSGQGAGLSSHVIGEAGGQETHTITATEMPAHTHLPRAVSATGSSPSPTGGYWAGSAVINTLYGTAQPDAVMAPQQVSPAGGSQPYNNMMPFQTLTCIIALQGIFPSQN